MAEIFRLIDPPKDAENPAGAANLHSCRQLDESHRVLDPYADLEFGNEEKQTSSELMLRVWSGFAGATIPIIQFLGLLIATLRKMFESNPKGSPNLVGGASIVLVR